MIQRLFNEVLSGSCALNKTGLTIYYSYYLYRLYRRECCSVLPLRVSLWIKKKWRTVHRVDSLLVSNLSQISTQEQWLQSHTRLQTFHHRRGCAW